MKAPNASHVPRPSLGILILTGKFVKSLVQRIVMFFPMSVLGHELILQNFCRGPDATILEEIGDLLFGHVLVCAAGGRREDK